MSGFYYVLKRNGLNRLPRNVRKHRVQLWQQYEKHTPIRLEKVSGRVLPVEGEKEVGGGESDKNLILVQRAYKCFLTGTLRAPIRLTEQPCKLLCPAGLEAILSTKYAGESCIGNLSDADVCTPLCVSLPQRKEGKRRDTS